MLRELTSGAHKAVKALLTRRVELQCDRMLLRYRDVSLKKIPNWILVESSIYVRPERPWGWPTHLQTDRVTCKARCKREATRIAGASHWTESASAQ